MSQPEFDKEKIRVYWDSKRSYIMTTLGGLFGLTLAGFTFANAIIQAAGPNLVLSFGATLGMLAIALAFGKALRGVRKQLGNVALKTYDLLDKVAKNQSISDELRKLHKD